MWNQLYSISRYILHLHFGHYITHYYSLSYKFSLVRMFIEFRHIKRQYIHAWHSGTFSLQDGCLGDASNRGPVRAVQPVRPGNCWELRHAAVTLLSAGIEHHNENPPLYECFNPGFTAFRWKTTDTSVIINFDWDRCCNSILFSSGKRGDMSGGCDGRMLQNHTDLKIVCNLYPSVWGSVLLFMLISTWFVRYRTISRIQAAEKTLN